jgi:hypothetical protein
VSGSSSNANANYDQADLFTVGGTGNQTVSEIDLGVTHESGLNTFSASIWTDVSGIPGSQVAGASWNLSTSAP